MDKSIYDDDKEKRGHLVQNSMVSTEAMLTVASVATLIRRASRSGDISSPILNADIQFNGVPYQLLSILKPDHHS